MITQEELKRQLHYNQQTGYFTWLVRSGTRGVVGKIAGFSNIRGYVDIKINGKTYPQHRLAWMYMYGEFPKYDIDHINGIRNDNRIINIREATRTENMLNSGKKPTNKSGFKGASFHKASKKWVAQASLNGKKTHLGLHDTVEQAAVAYENFARANHGEFYNKNGEEKCL